MTDESATPAPPARRRFLRYLIRAAGLSAPLLLVALLIYGITSKSPDTRIDDSLAHAHAVAAPSFKLEVLQRGALGPKLSRDLGVALSDGQISVRELRGTPVVLNFWASWCVPCREEAPLLQRTWRTLARPRNVLLLGLDMQDIRTDARDFMGKFQIDYLNIRDPTNDVARSYGVTGLPETFFLDRRGRIVGHVIGVVRADQLRMGIVGTLSGQVVGARHGGAQRPER
jgi:cytochrome c biogenesis protein CcmG/thiol:disulfide interchange protein DsbE